MLAPCVTQHRRSRPGSAQGSSTRPSSNPQSHGPSPAHPFRPASLFHFCKVGVRVTDRMEGCGPLHLGFGKFLAPPSLPLCSSHTGGGARGLFLSSPDPSGPQWSNGQCGEALLKMGTHTHTHTPSHYPSPASSSLWKNVWERKGKQVPPDPQGQSSGLTGPKPWAGSNPRAS